MKTLTWKVDKTIPTACPDYQPDPYTGEYPSFRCAVYHFETITEDKTAEFSTKKEVEEFALKAPSSCYDFKLNGKPLKDKRKSQSGDGTITYTEDLTSCGIGNSGTSVDLSVKE